MIGSPERSIDVQLLPLATVPFLGRVEPPLSTGTRGTAVSVMYFPVWLCEFFSLSDCGVESMGITSATLDADGSFALELPDFAHDPTVSPFRDHGHFRFWASDPPKNTLVWSKNDKDRQHSLEVAGSYPGELMFQVEIAE